MMLASNLTSNPNSLILSQSVFYVWVDAGHLGLSVGQMVQGQISCCKMAGPALSFMGLCLFEYALLNGFPSLEVQETSKPVLQKD